MDNYPISSNSLEKFYHIDGEQFAYQYKEYLSDYYSWTQRPHADDWITFPQNVGSRLSIDETSLSNGELYTILTNKATKGKKGVLVAMVKGTKAEDVIEAIKIIPLSRRRKVKEITLDMAGSMNQIVRQCFPKATRVIDRFHVQKLALDDYHKVFCSDFEKTIIDCLFKPEYAGGIVEIGKAIHQLKEKFDYEKLYDYVVRFNSQAVIKRLGFLLELLEIENLIIEKLQKQKSSSYILLDTELPREGRHWNRWNIQINIEPETIKSAIYT